MSADAILRTPRDCVGTPHVPSSRPRSRPAPRDRTQFGEQFVELPQNADDLPQIQFFCRGFLGLMLATRADRVRNSDYAGTRQRETQPEVPIHGPKQMGFEVAAGAFPDFASEDHLRLEEPVALFPRIAPVHRRVK